MKLFCRCNEPWIIVDICMNEGNETRQIISDIGCNCKCKTMFYWYNADHENMMFDLKNMNQM